MKKEPKNFPWKDVLKSVWYFIAEDRKSFSVSFSVLAVIYLYDLVPPFIVGKVVDFFSNYERGQSLAPFYFLAVFTTVTYILASQIRLKSKNVLGILRSHVRTRARVWGFERLTEFSLEWHNKENTGNKLQRIYTGAEAVSGWIKIFQKDLLKIFVSTFGVVLFFLFTDSKFVFIIVIYVVVFMFISLAFGRKIYALSNEFNKLNQSAGGTYMESAHNMLAIKAMGNEKGIIDRVQDRETLSRDTAIKKINTNNLKWRVFQCFNGIMLGVFIYFLGSSVVSQSITIGMILVFYSYFDRLQRLFGELDELYIDMIDMRSDIGQMMPIFRETDFIKTGNDPFPTNWDKIEIKNASMDYGSKQMGLEGFSLILKRNTKTGIAGLSGSGKSTLAKIILGLYALKLGSFKIGNKDYYAISHNETLSNITVVLQETELFNLSLRENITMMRGENSELLNTALEISELKEVISKLPEGLDSLIGEKGYMLSGGERQRLGIARAIYKNASIIILDEATSSLDSETEGKIMEKLLGEYGKDKTFLMIAHRLGTLKYTDNIAVMERGQVMEEGSYNELMNNPNSVFYRMNKEQKSNGSTPLSR